MENDIVRMLFLRRQWQKKRWKIKTISGAPPLSFKAKAGALKDYRIYGNTAGGESVGDKTGNLFDGSFIHRSVIEATVSADDPNKRSIVVDVSSYSNGNKITFSRETSAGNKFQMYQVTSPLKGGRLLNTNVVLGDPNVLLATITLDDISNYHYLMIFLNGALNPITDEELLASKIMVNVGNTPLPYEPYGYKLPVTVEGKNLWSGVVEQGSVSITGDYGSNTKRIRSKNIPIEPGTYTVSTNLLIRIIYAYNDGKKIGACLDAPLGTYSLSFTVPAGTNNISVAMMKIVDNVEVDITPSDFIWGQIEKGSEATTYESYRTPVITPIYLPEQIRKVGDEEEYIDYGEQKQHRVRKNLLKNTVTSQTINGVTFTVKSDGSVTCNGTATAHASLRRDIGKIPIGIYKLSGCPKNGAYNTYRLDVRDSSDVVIPYNSDNVLDTGNGHLFNSTNAHHVEIRIENGYTCDNLTFYPMIRKADIEDDTYEPYIENTDLDVTLPELPTVTGTNVLTVGTAVQPSGVDITGKIKKGE